MRNRRYSLKNGIRRLTCLRGSNLLITGMPVIILLVATAFVAFLTGCVGRAGVINASLNEEITLAIGQSAKFTGEDLEIRFVDVISDSRCPQGAVCIWAGEASSLVEITISSSTYQKVLTQPGLSEPPPTDFNGYEIMFSLEPYPKVGKDIKKGDYRLLLTVSKS